MNCAFLYKLSVQLRPFIENEVTRMRAPVDVARQVALILYYLRDEGLMRKIHVF